MEMVNFYLTVPYRIETRDNTKSYNTKDHAEVVLKLYSVQVFIIGIRGRDAMPTQIWQLTHKLELAMPPTEICNRAALNLLFSMLQHCLTTGART